MLSAFIDGLLQVFSWPTLPLMLIGVAIGFVVGILPGLGGVVALALMLPFTFHMGAISAFAFLLGMMAITGTTGDITSILFGVPGESISAAMVIDGHPMAKNGEAGRALGAALMSSLVGSVVGAFILAATIPVVRPLVLSFGSPEFFALAVLGVMFIAAVSGKNVLKGLIAGGVGLALSTVGLDELSGMQRYTFGSVELWSGISLVAVTTGIFGLPEIIDLWRHGTSISHQPVDKVGGVREGVIDTFRHWSLTLRSSAIGTFAGVIPGLGASIGQWLAYAHAVHSSPKQERFGKGDVRGVLGPGAANNSSMGGGLVPMIAFGVPGNVGFAILLGAFLIQGIVPGPEMLTKHLTLTFSFAWIIVASNVVAVGICFLFIKQLVKVTELQAALVIPPVVILIFLGGYVDSSSWFAMFITLASGALGYVMERLDWPRPPLILGLVLGSLIEKNLFTSYEAYGISFLSRPIVIIVLLLGVAVTARPLWSWLRAHKPTLSSEEIQSPVPEMIASTMVACVVGWALIDASRWPFDARLFPQTIESVVLILIALHLAISARRLRARRYTAVATSVDDSSGLAGHRKRELAMGAWCVAFALIISLLGFKIGGALASFAFLISIRERWKIAIGLPLGVYVFFFVAADVLKLASLDPGIATRWLGLPSVDDALLQAVVRLFHGG